MNNSKNDNKNFGTILTNETDKTTKTDKIKEKGGTEYMEKDVDKYNPKTYANSINESKEYNKDNYITKGEESYTKEKLKQESKQIISTGYDNDFMKDFGSEVSSNIKTGVGNVEGIFDDGRLFKDDFKNYGKYEVEKHYEKEIETKKEVESKKEYEKNKHEDKKHENHGEREDCHWTCEDVLCETEFDCECEPLSEALADIVESIAHQENGIAKILDSESKKICRAISMAECVDDLVKVNKSVQDTIKQINNVQIVLISKLQEVSDICDGCCDDDYGRNF